MSGLDKQPKHADISKRVFEQVIQQLRFEIASGKVEPGDRLPSDRKLALIFGVGRGSIREAIRALELFGLVYVKRGRQGGAYFTENCREIAEASFTKLPIIGSTILNSLEFRKALEPKAAALAAERRNDDDVALLRESLTMMKNGLDVTEAFVESNQLFHDTVARSTKNPYFGELIPQFLARPEIRAGTGSSDMIERSMILLMHTRIVEAIIRRDAEAAEFWMAGHIGQIAEELQHGRMLLSSRETTTRKPKKRRTGKKGSLHT
jgi:GntR family transcriptional regulator, transcriptional repressor for pyruvate dehydrogenase complex